MVPLDQFVKSALMLGATALVVAVLFLAKGLLVPLTLAVLLSSSPPPSRIMSGGTILPPFEANLRKQAPPNYLT
ncbi:MAG: hypothetical protein WCJ35_27725 [Planctomycetota bacterium]